MNRKWAVAAAMAFGLAQPAVADVLYDNAPGIGPPESIDLAEAAMADSFTLTGASIVTGVRFNSWLFPGEVLQTIDWGITTTANFFPIDGTASVSQTFLHTSDNGQDVDLEAFSIAPRILGPGTYWLVLQNPVNTIGTRTTWETNHGPSIAYRSNVGLITGNSAVYDFGSETFQIIGTTAVPEPAAWALMLTGFGGLGAVLRRRRREAAA